MESTESLLQQLLNQLEPDVQSKVLQVVKATGLSETDPIFLILIATSTIQVLIEEAPGHLRQTYEVCHQQVMTDLKGYEKAASRGIEARLADAVQEIIRKAKASQKEPQWKVFFSAGAMTLLVLFAGVFAGTQWEKQGQAIARQQGNLTIEEAQALDWALSPQGQYAQQLLLWNDSIQGGECQAQVKKLGIRLRYGGLTANNGFCFLWVVPPEKREFQ
jgi:hypothetical protein